ncbi:hypothetical protein RDWZM_007367 [Blomia tropicalis]|uniref:C2H2-type domain-containing protein n=1 Tax=Blomia tropicalis TaxID=40697 RepID=A0A9Q0LZ16_BLOTA|nr:hypothetical protein BLOT_016179 [Blomia tropicalis]KAJ6216210.1 hypothetical protein RDWZM_007367 [Blomia tropicalis]
MLDEPNTEIKEEIVGENDMPTNQYDFNLIPPEPIDVNDNSLNSISLQDSSAFTNISSENLYGNEVNFSGLESYNNEEIVMDTTYIQTNKNDSPIMLKIVHIKPNNEEQVLVSSKVPTSCNLVLIKYIKRNQSGTINSSPTIVVKPNNKLKCTNFVCEYEKCGKSFVSKNRLRRHQMIHTGICPFRCRWMQCNYSSNQKAMVIRHIRTQHFKLPFTVKAQKEMKIVDHRDPNDYLEIVTGN